MVYYRVYIECYIGYGIYINIYSCAIIKLLYMIIWHNVVYVHSMLFEGLLPFTCLAPRTPGPAPVPCAA